LKTLVLGELADISGDVTQNTWVGARSARDLEASLGYGAGRLAAGWWVLVLKQKLTPADFKFSGLTIRSGGREGLPAATEAADRARPHVHDQVLAARGPAGTEALQRSTLASIPETGAGRLVKVIPVTRHASGMAPDQQYPMGGGGLQWTLIRPRSFLVAMAVDENGVARIPGFSAFLGESARYDDRARLNSWLNDA